MAPKQQLDKGAWQWAETTDPENVTEEHVCIAYRLNLAACSSSCRRNCKGNPRCLLGLGEKNWLGKLSEEKWYGIDDPNEERKSPGWFVGLKNLGATCYMNSLLQLWYHNPVFRKAIYLWRPEDDPDERQVLEAAAGCEDPDNLPHTCVARLQQLFAKMQFGYRRYIDPEEFVKSLGLKTGEQQDAQEFSKLFMNLLENQLRFQKLQTVQNIVGAQFQGEYEYVTCCSNCKSRSSCPSKFYELDLPIKNNNADLEDCIKEFLQEERLEGANQYSCGFCHSKQDATRNIRLVRLPPVLNLQLLRFVYDRTTGQKKKLRHYVRFPEVLDMSKYLGAPDDTHVYNLAAVLLHRGQSANSGHYFANIKDRQTLSWFEFNDETVQQVEGKELKLGADDAIENGGKSVKKPRLAKGCHMSPHAYMLVYNHHCPEHQVNLEDNSEEWDLSERLQEYVMQDNSKFEEWVEEIRTMREQNLLNGKARQNEVMDIYNKLSVPQDSPTFDWISIEWLSSWLKQETEATPTVDNSKLLCPHSMLLPEAVPEVKCISTEAADKIYKRYGGGPRLNQNFLCTECVVANCRNVRLKARINEDYKYIFLQQKQPIADGDAAYWIGKTSLRFWRSMLPKMYKTDHDGVSGIGENGDTQQDELPDSAKNVECNESSSGECIALPFHSTVRPSDPHGDVAMDEQEDCWILGFNEEIVCTHKKLSIIASERRLIQVEIWHRLKSYFLNAPEFSRCAEVCTKCQNDAMEDINFRASLKQTAQDQKAALSDLYYDKNRPSGASACTERLYAISRDFVDAWRRFVKDPGRNEPVPEVNNASLLCPHDCLVYLPEEPDAADSGCSSNRLVLLWPAEWEAMRRLFVVDREIALFCRCGGGGGAGGAGGAGGGRGAVPAEDGSSGCRQQQRDSPPSEATATTPALHQSPPAPTVPARSTTSRQQQQQQHHSKPALHPDYVSEPAMCDACYSLRLLEEERQLLDYVDAKLFVRKVASAAKSAASASAAGGCSSLSPPVSPAAAAAAADLASSRLDVSSEWSGAEDGDPEFTQAVPSKKRKRLETSDVSGATGDAAVANQGGCAGGGGTGGGGGGANHPVVTTTSLTSTSSAPISTGCKPTLPIIRRSLRHHRQREEKEVTVSSTNTLKDLKVKIMALFAVAPFDQHLSLDGRELTGNDRTLADLRVVPNSTIFLQADEAYGGEMDEDYVKDTAPEEGFKGTQLLCR